jgi:hypothetical protein
MYISIKAPDWIDFTKFDLLGYKKIEAGEYGIRHPFCNEWTFQDFDTSENVSEYCFCFKKIQKFEWPECIANRTSLRWSSLYLMWVVDNTINVEAINLVLKPECQIDTSTLDKNKVYIKGSN